LIEKPIIRSSRVMGFFYQGCFIFLCYSVDLTRRCSYPNQRCRGTGCIDGLWARSSNWPVNASLSWERKVGKDCDEVIGYTVAATDPPTNRYLVLPDQLALQCDFKHPFVVGFIYERVAIWQPFDRAAITTKEVIGLESPLDFGRGRIDFENDRSAMMCFFDTVVKNQYVAGAGSALRNHVRLVLARESAAIAARILPDNLARPTAHDHDCVEAAHTNEIIAGLKARVA
jgi:hypothetical protein